MKKIEFSKILVMAAIIVLFAIGVWSIIYYYALAELAIENDVSVLPDSAIPIACITTILGAILSYCLYQGLLKNSLNKNKLTIDESGKITPIHELDIEIENTFPIQTPVDCEYKERA